MAPSVRRILTCFILLAFLGSPAFSQDDGKEKITLEADYLVYEEAEGIARAEGNAKLRTKDMTLYASHLEYHVYEQVAKATAGDGGEVVMLSDGKRLSGERLEYDLLSKEGRLYNASGQVDSVFLKGGSLEVAPAKAAMQRKWISKGDAKRVPPEGQVGRWSDVSITTCDQPRPHYRLVTSHVTVIPGYRLVAKNPKIYIGESLLFSYPFDYTVDLREKKEGASAVPFLAYDSDKGVGMRLSTSLSWSEEFEADATIFYWTEEDFEGEVSGRYRPNPELDLFLLSQYTYSSPDDEKLWRPQWGANWDHQGWTANVLWSEREDVEVEKEAGVTYEGTLWRSPEFSLSSPWKKVGSHNEARLLLFWGEYEEVGESYRRSGWGVEARGEGDTMNGLQIKPYWRLRYLWWDYDHKDDLQEITSANVGFTWKAGIFSMRTAYLRRWVSGKSPMAWDDYDEREELYQTVSMQVTGKWHLSLRGGYDLRDSHLDEMVYRVIYDEHCYQWEFVYVDDMVEDDDWAGLRLTIKAYPKQPVFLNDKIQKLDELETEL